MLLGRKPAPEFADDVGEFGAGARLPHAAEQLKLILARPSQESFDELGLAAKKKQHHARTGLDGAR